MEALTTPRQDVERRRFDAVTLLSILIYVNFLVPARAAIPQLGAAGRPAALLGLVCLLWWLIDGLRNRGDRPRPTWIHGVLALTFVAMLLSIAFGLNRIATVTERTSADRSVLSFLGAAGIALLAADCVRNYDDIQLLFRRAVHAASLVAVIAIVQFGFRFDASEYLMPPGLEANGGGEAIDYRGGFRRVAGTANHAIELGVISALMLLLALHFAFHARDRVDAQRRWIQAGLLALAIAVSISRSGVLALSVGGIVAMMAWPARQKIKALGIGLIGLVAFYMVNPGLVEVFTNLFLNVGDDSSVEFRTKDYAEVGEFISDSPWIGRGTGTFLPSEYFVLDNQLLGTLVQTGALGLVAILGFYAVGFLLPRHVRAMTGPGEVGEFAQTICGVVFAAFIATTTFDSHGFPIHRNLVYLSIGLAVALWRIARENRLPTDESIDPDELRYGPRAYLEAVTSLTRRGD